MLKWGVFLLATCALESVACQSYPLTSKDFRKGAEFILDAVTTFRRANRKMDNQARSLKSQAAIPASTRFPCDVTMGRSPHRPSSVHRLRPGDIDVVGAMGDSIMAAFGANAVRFPSVIVADRGVSFAVGGAESWRSVFTLPNVLKLYNPKLVGFSHGTGFSWNQQSQFNVAEGFATSADLLYQARLLVQRLKSDSRVDFQKHWKLVTVLIGNNDLCSWICYDDADEVTRRHRSEMIGMLDFLRDNVPRLFVSIIAPPNLSRSMFSKLVAPSSCYWINRLECSCLLDLQFQDKMPIYNAVIEKWAKIDKEITERAQYADKDDFAVVFQPFTRNVTLPHVKSKGGGLPAQDSTYFAPDCFHFSQKMHAIAANALWNNLMQPAGSKSSDLNHRLLDEVICPDKDHPYLFTTKNSVGAKRQH